MENFLFIGGIVIILAVIIFAFFLISSRQRKQMLKKPLTRKLLLIKLPQPEDKKGQAAMFKEEVNLSEQLFSILTTNKEGAVLEAAVHHVGEEIHFYISVLEKDISFISRQIEGIFKDVQINQVSEYNIFQPNGCSAGFYLKQDNHYALMLRTYLESDVDTFSPILSGLSKINELGEGVAIQLLIKPAPASFKKNLFGMINKLRQGESFSKLASENFINMKDFEGLTKSSEDKKENQPSIVDQESIKALEKKVSKLSHQIAIFVAVIAGLVFISGFLRGIPTREIFGAVVRPFSFDHS